MADKEMKKPPATRVCRFCQETMEIAEHHKFKGFQQVAYLCPGCGYQLFYHMDMDGSHAKKADFELLPEDADEEEG